MMLQTVVTPQRKNKTSQTKHRLRTLSTTTWTTTRLSFTDYPQHANKELIAATALYAAEKPTRMYHGLRYEPRMITSLNSIAVAVRSAKSHTTTMTPLWKLRRLRYELSDSDGECGVGEVQRICSEQAQRQFIFYYFIHFHYLHLTRSFSHKTTLVFDSI